MKSKNLQSKGTRNKVEEKIRYQRLDLIKGDISYESTVWLRTERKRYHLPLLSRSQAHERVCKVVTYRQSINSLNSIEFINIERQFRVYVIYLRKNIYKLKYI